MTSDVMRNFTINDVQFLRFKIFDNLSFVNHAVSTRHGGVSTMPELKSLNLGFKTCDDPKNVIENYNRFCSVTGFDTKNLVFAKQTHSDNVRIATKADRGKGIFYERDYDNVDATITNTPKISLVIHTADCVPIAFADPANKAIGNAHCGWRGTFASLAEKTLLSMHDNFNTNPNDVICAIGPCICVSCYEVSKDLYEQFSDKFHFDKYIISKNGKYYLNLPMINRQILINCGVKPENIAVSDICTCCNRQDFFSHRGLGPKRGLISSIIEIK